MKTTTSNTTFGSTTFAKLAISGLAALTLLGMSGSAFAKEIRQPAFTVLQYGYQDYAQDDDAQADNSQAASNLVGAIGSTDGSFEQALQNFGNAWQAEDNAIAQHGDDPAWLQQNEEEGNGYMDRFNTVMGRRSDEIEQQTLQDMRDAQDCGNPYGS